MLPGKVRRLDGKASLAVSIVDSFESSRLVSGVTQWPMGSATKEPTEKVNASLEVNPSPTAWLLSLVFPLIKLKAYTRDGGIASSYYHSTKIPRSRNKVHIPLSV